MHFYPWKKRGRGCIWVNCRCVAKNCYSGVIPRIADDMWTFEKNIYIWEVLNYYYAIICHYMSLLDYVFKLCKLIYYSYFCACLWCFLWSLTLIIPQRWEPISPQQRYGTSIVEVYRIVEEVHPSIILSTLIFWSLLSFDEYSIQFLSLHCSLSI